MMINSLTIKFLTECKSRSRLGWISWKPWILRGLLAVHLLVSSQVLLVGQTTQQPTTRVVFPTEGQIPEPYDPNEFHPSLRFLRRASIIAVGTFPFVFLGVSMVYDLGRYAYLGLSGSPQASNYLPLFFAPPNKPPNTQSENLFLVLSSVGISIILGIVDGVFDRRNLERRSTN